MTNLKNGRQRRRSKEAFSESACKEAGTAAVCGSKRSQAEFGINDVKYGFCSLGSAGRIYERDDWAKSAIQVPMVIGHEFVGEVVTVVSMWPIFIMEIWYQ